MMSWKRSSSEGNARLISAMCGMIQCVVKPVETESVTVSTPVLRSSISRSACSMPEKPREIAS